MVSVLTFGSLAESDRSRPTLPPAAEDGVDAVSRARLRVLLAAAGGLPLEDESGWRHLRGDAIALTRRLAAQGALPAALVVDADDPPALVARTVAAAWRRAEEGARDRARTWR